MAKTKSFPKLNEITLRYARQLISYADDFAGGISEQPYKLETYLQSEFPDMDTELNRCDFWKYLEDINAVKVSYPKEFKAVDYTDINQTIFFPPFHMVQLLNIEPVRELLQIAEKQISDKQMKSKVDWNPMLSILTYKSIRHKFQQGGKKDAHKLKVFEALLKEQQCTRTKKKGLPLTSKMIASRAGITEDRREDTFTASVEKQVVQLVKDITKDLKGKKFPILIKKQNNTYLMIVLE